MVLFPHQLINGSYFFFFFVHVKSETTRAMKNHHHLCIAHTIDDSLNFCHAFESEAFIDSVTKPYQVDESASTRVVYESSREKLCKRPPIVSSFSPL